MSTIPPAPAKVIGTGFTGWTFDRTYGYKMLVVNGVPVRCQRLHDGE